MKKVKKWRLFSYRWRRRVPEKMGPRTGEEGRNPISEHLTIEKG